MTGKMNYEIMTEQMRKEILEEGLLEAKDTLQFHLRYQYGYGDLEVDDSFSVIQGFYVNFLWSYIYEAYAKQIMPPAPELDVMALIEAGLDPLTAVPPPVKPPEVLPEGKLTYDELGMLLDERGIGLYPTAYKWPISKEELNALLEIYDEAVADADAVVRGAVDNYFMEKLVYEMTASYCAHALAGLLAEHGAIFEICIDDFKADEFRAHVAGSEDDLIICTTRETVYEDTLRAINKLKDPDAMYELKLLRECFKPKDVNCHADCDHDEKGA